MTDLTEEPELLAESPQRRGWRKIGAAISGPVLPNGLRRGLALILLPSLILVGIEIYNAVRIVPGLQQSQAQVAHSFEVVSAAHRLDQALQDAERGQRGFLITGDETYLKPYAIGERQIPEALQKLRQLTQDNPPQQHRIELLAEQIKTKLDEMGQTIATRRKEGFDAARRIVGTNLGRDVMRAITAEITTIITAEDWRIGEHQARFLNAARVSAMISALAAALALAVIVLGGIFLVLAHYRTLRSQAFLRRSEERFRLLVSGVRDHAIFMLDPAGNVASWNEGAERIEGYRADEVIGSHFSRFFPADERARGAPNRLLEVAATAGSAEEEAWRVRKDGSRFWASVVITALHDPDGRLRGYAKVVRDITERRRQQETLDQHRATLAQLQKMEAIGQLTGGVAHDFNNLLQTILGSLELLQRPSTAADAARRARLLDAAQRAAEQGAALTQRLLAFARRQALAPQIVDVNKLVGSISELLHRTLGETIAIETVLAAGLWRTHVDPNQLENAMLNLAVNARDAMPRGGKLTIETGNTWLDDQYAAAHGDITAGQYVMVAVTDTGEGMPAEAMARAFEPFFTTKPEGKGTGLGLAQVHGFVKQSGGHIKLYSEFGQGTTIKIYLPRFIGPGEAETSPSPFKSDTIAGRESVLLVEDNDDVRLYGAEALMTLGYTVFEASDSHAALRILEAHPEIALLFTDVGLPGFNGRRLAEEGKRRVPGLKVLYTTGYARNAIVHNGVLDAGVDLIVKPFTTDTLGRKLEQMLRGK
jgi:PAS domain S-box-containing protein